MTKGLWDRIRTLFSKFTKKIGNLVEQEEIAQIVASFMDNFFKEELEVAQKELDFLYNNQFVKPSLDYIKLRRFLTTATNNLKTIDPNIMEGLLTKIHQDTDRLYTYYQEFEKKIKIEKLVYIRDFLPSVPEYKRLENEVTITEAMKKRFQAISVSTERELAVIPTPKTAEEITYYKLLRKRNVDAIDGLARSRDKLIVISQELKQLEEDMSDEFYTQFREYVESLKDGLLEVLNTKSYYFDKLLWDRASKSAGIRKFFQQARIEGDFSTRTFIEYYLRNIDINKSSTSDWHNYLHEVLKIFQ